MATTIVTRFRECNGLMKQIVAQLEAISNFALQRTVVEGACRRAACSVGSAGQYGAENDVMLFFPHVADVPPCACGPLGVLRLFPAAIPEAIISQHDHDINTLVGTLHSIIQQWQKYLSNARASLDSVLGSSYDNSPGGAGKEAGGGGRGNAMLRQHLSMQQIRVGCAALVASIAMMSGVLREVLLALRADVAEGDGAKSSCPPSINSSSSRSGHQQELRLVRVMNQQQQVQMATGGGTRRNEDSDQISAPLSGRMSLLDVLERLSPWLQREWQQVQASTFVEESYVILAM